MFARILDLTRTIEYGYPTAVAELARDTELLRDAQNEPEGSPLRRHLSDDLTNFRQGRDQLRQYRELLTELDELVSLHLPDVAAELRIIGTAQPTVGDDLVRELRTIRAAAAGRVAAEDQGQDVEPVTWLLNWREIVDALPGREHNETDRNLITKLNHRFDGPIIFQGQGKQPFCNKNKLLEWWNRFEELHKELQDQDRDRQATVADQHGYGATGTVVPGIDGSVKRRRKDAKQ